MSPIYRRGNSAVSDWLDIGRGPPLVDDPERMQQMWRNSDRWPNDRLTTDLRKARATARDDYWHPQAEASAIARGPASPSGASFANGRPLLFQGG